MLSLSPSCAAVIDFVSRLEKTSLLVFESCNLGIRKQRAHTLGKLFPS